MINKSNNNSNKAQQKLSWLEAKMEEVKTTKKGAITRNKKNKIKKSTCKINFRTQPMNFKTQSILHRKLIINQWKT